MCAGDDHNCPQFEQHRQKLLDDLDAERRSFLKSAFVAKRQCGCRMGGGRRAGVPGFGAIAPRPADLSLLAGDGRHGALGLLQQAAEAAT